MTRSIDQDLAAAPLHFGERLEGREGEILEAAFHCIVEQGIAATSTRAVAARVGISQGAIHYYFRNKDEMLARVLENLFANSTANIRAVAAADRPPRRKVADVLALGGSLVVARPEELVAFFAFWAHAMAIGGRWRRRYQALFRQFRRTIVSILHEGDWPALGGAEGETRVAALIVAVIQGLGLQYVMDPEAFDWPEMEQTLEGLVGPVVDGGLTPPPVAAKETLS